MLRANGNGALQQLRPPQHTVWTAPPPTHTHTHTFAQVEVGASSVSERLVVVHGALMVAAFLALLPTGILLARHRCVCVCVFVCVC